MDRTPIALNQPANLDHVTWWRHENGVWLQHNVSAPGLYRLALPPLPGRIREIELLCHGGRGPTGPQHQQLPEWLPRLRLRMVRLGVESQDLGDVFDAPGDLPSYEKEHGFSLFLPDDPADPNKGIASPYRSYQVLVSGEFGAWAEKGGFSFDHLIIGTEPVEFKRADEVRLADMRELRI
jgi:hypothetical protein